MTQQMGIVLLYVYTPTITITVGLIGEGSQGEWQEPVHGGVGDGAGVAKGAVARAAGDPDLGEPVHEGLAAVRVEHAHHDADETVVVGPEKDGFENQLLLLGPQR